MATQMETEPQTVDGEQAVAPPEATLETFFEKLDELNTLTKWFNKQGKSILKKSTKAPRRRTGGGGGQKSGFSVPVKVADILARFLEMDPTEHIPRTEVTKRLTSYIKEKELQCENKKHFKVDKALADVFSIEPGTQTNWFEMQKFLAKLLTSVTKAEAAAEGSKDGAQAASSAGEPSVVSEKAKDAKRPETSPAPEPAAKKKIKKSA